MISLKGQPTFYGQRFSRYEFLTNFEPILAQFGDLGPFWHFWALPVVWKVHISENNYSKSSLVIILRGQPTLYYHISQDNRFGPILGIWALFCILSHFWKPSIAKIHLTLPIFLQNILDIWTKCHKNWFLPISIVMVGW